MKRETKDVYQFEFAEDVYCSEAVNQFLLGLLSSRISKVCLEIKLKLIEENKEDTPSDYYSTVKENASKELMKLIKTDRNFQKNYGLVVLKQNGNTYIFKQNEFEKRIFWRFRICFNNIGIYHPMDRGLLIR